MGDWVYTVRQREPKMEIPGKISLRAPLNRATGPGSGAHEPKAARHQYPYAGRGGEGAYHSDPSRNQLGRRRAEWSGRQTRSRQDNAHRQNAKASNFAGNSGTEYRAIGYRCQSAARSVFGPSLRVRRNLDRRMA